jgi:hypothetical protein
MTVEIFFMSTPTHSPIYVVVEPELTLLLAEDVRQSAMIQHVV